MKATGTNTEVITRVKPLRVTQRLTPKRDRRAPFTFRTTGRVVPPASLSTALACASSTGIVAVQVKKGKETISNRRVALKPDCSYSSSVTFKERKRFGKRRRLKFVVRFLGNERLEPVINTPMTARVR